LNFDKFRLEGKPSWKIILRGAAIPGVIVAACALVGFGMALSNNGDIEQTTKIGVGLGLFFSLWGGLYLVFEIISARELSWRVRRYLCLGYIITWVACISLIVFYVRS